MKLQAVCKPVSVREDIDKDRLMKRYEEVHGKSDVWSTVYEHYMNNRSEYERFYVCPHCNAKRFLCEVEGRQEGTYKWYFTIM